eukprot:COSAG01_NODE_1246_length_11073_cov_38.365683_1_plen_37_part_00
MAAVQPVRLSGSLLVGGSEACGSLIDYLYNKNLLPG